MPHHCTPEIVVSDVSEKSSAAWAGKWKSLAKPVTRSGVPFVVDDWEPMA